MTGRWGSGTPSTRTRDSVKGQDPRADSLLEGEETDRLAQASSLNPCHRCVGQPARQNPGMNGLAYRLSIHCASHGDRDSVAFRTLFDSGSPVCVCH